MKKKKRSIKKYLTGTKVTGYQPNPGEVLEQNNIDIASAKFEADSNPLHMGMTILGNLALDYGMTKAAGGIGDGDSTGSGLFDKAIESGLMKNIMQGVQFLEKGGKVEQVPIEVEGDEMYEKPDGEVGEFEGPSHAEGGIKTTMPEGTMIYSDQIMIGDSSIADRKKSREKKMADLEKKLAKNPTDKILKDTMEKLRMNNSLEETSDLNVQEFASILDNLEEFAKGGCVKAKRKKYFGGTGWGGLTNEEEEKGYPDEPGVPAQIAEPEKTSGAKMPFTTGDIFGMAGTAISTIGPYLQTLRNRSKDTPYKNYFEGFGEDALAANQEAMEFAKFSKDKAIGDVKSAARDSRKRNRGNVRGINQMVALDTLTDMHTSKAITDIYDNWATKMTSFLDKKGALSNKRDEVVMTGAAQADQANRQQRDNYATQIAQNIIGMGSGMQKFGKDLNKRRMNQDFLDILPDVSQYGLGYVFEGGRLKLKAFGDDEQTT